MLVRVCTPAALLLGHHRALLHVQILDDVRVQTTVHQQVTRSVIEVDSGHLR